MPGLLHDHCSGFHPLALDTGFSRRFDLAAHGLEWLWPEVQYAHPLRGGRGAAVVRSVDETAERLGRDGSRLAFGSPGFGPAGFRASRSQASRIAHVTSDPTARVTSYADEGIPVISRLVDDLPATRAWVHDVLGELAVDSGAAARQRDTVRVFLESAFSYSATASQLMLHRNSIRYRLEKASLQLGRSVTDKPLDTQLALALCRVLGSVILVPDTGPGTAGASSTARGNESHRR